MSTRQKLIDIIASKNPDISKEDIYEVVTESFDYISTELAKGNRVEIRGFGSFELGKRKVISPIWDNKETIRNTVKYKASSNLLK